MLVFPHSRPDIRSEGCRTSRWMPAERFAPYFARPTVLTRLRPQEEDEDLSGGSSPERGDTVQCEGACGWRGCVSRFPSVSRLSAHVARTHAHPHTDGLFYCNWKDCSRPQRGFNARYKMLVHIRTHTNERPHTCNQCQKSFSRAENLKIHLRSHSGEKPYVCPYEGCGKAYSNSSDRFKHTRTHTVDKPYGCKVPGCNKRYTDPSSLRKHVKTYRHFTSERDTKHESIEITTDNSSPLRDNQMYGPLTHTYTNMPSRETYSISYTNPALGAPLGYLPLEPYIPLDIYPMRVPPHDIMYSEYTHTPEDHYKNYYINYTTDVSEKVYDDIEIGVDADKHADVPLNLITKRLECKPIADLVRHADLPLDLSTKS